MICGKIIFVHTLLCLSIESFTKYSIVRQSERKNIYINFEEKVFLRGGEQLQKDKRWERETFFEDDVLFSLDVSFDCEH